MQQTKDRLALEPKLVAMKEKVREEQEGRAAEAVKNKVSELDVLTNAMASSAESSAARRR